MPANLPVGRDLTIRCKIENGRYYCALGRSNEAGHYVALNPRGPESRRRGAVYEAVYAYPDRPAIRFDVSAGNASDPRRHDVEHRRRLSMFMNQMDIDHTE
jgi:hypothetical protein